MTQERWQYIQAYCREVFGNCDEHLAGLSAAAVARGFPDIAVSADVGRLLMLLTSMTQGRRAIEVGTLAGFSAIWIARGLRPGGRLITIESEPAHADFAEEQFRRAGVSERVSVHRGKGLDVLPRLRAELGDDSVDVVFLDAVKTEYPDYWRMVRPMIRTGGLILADNVLGSSWSIDQEDDPVRRVMDGFNRMVAADPDFECVAVPLRQGVLIGRRREARRLGCAAQPRYWPSV
jgi:caffeoyl-CoA O-methyltransferase